MGRRQGIGRPAARAARGVVPLAVLVLVLVLALAPRTAGAAEPAWTWPVAEPAEVVRPFDPPEHRYAAGHRGADLAAAPGAPVRAAGAGRVSYAGLIAGRGVVVVVHGDLRTTYEPVSADVVVGQQVAAGEPLGRLEAGHEGCAVAACLHWGLRRGDTYLDPVQLVGAGPVRLLPPAPQGATESTAASPVPAQGLAAPPADRPDTAAPDSPDTAAPDPAVSEPHWSLRAGEVPLGATAVVALAAGLALLTRPRRPPDGPASAGAAGLPAEEVLAPPVPGVVPVDLGAERLRRRTG